MRSSPPPTSPHQKHRITGSAKAAAAAEEGKAEVVVEVERLVDLHLQAVLHLGTHYVQGDGFPAAVFLRQSLLQSLLYLHQFLPVDHGWARRCRVGAVVEEAVLRLQRQEDHRHRVMAVVVLLLLLLPHEKAAVVLPILLHKMAAAEHHQLLTCFFSAEADAHQAVLT